jgi:hypothetical protein
MSPKRLGLALPEITIKTRLGASSRIVDPSVLRRGLCSASGNQQQDEKISHTTSLSVNTPTGSLFFG